MGFKISLFFIKIISFIPFFILYLVSSFLALIIILMPFLTSSARLNFTRVYPEKNGWQILWLTYKYVAACCDFLFEWIKMTRFSEKKMKRHCKFKNVDWLEQEIEKHHFVLCYGAHMVNFEVTTSLPLHLKQSGMCHLFLNGKPNKAQDWVMKYRSRYGAVNIPSKSPLRELLRLKNEVESGSSKFKGYVFGSLSDVDPRKDDKFSAPFLDHKLEVKVGAEKIARRMNMGFCYARFTRPKRGFYEVEFLPMLPQTDIEQDENAYTREFVRMLDENIRIQPEIWMQWGSPRF